MLKILRNAICAAVLMLPTSCFAGLLDYPCIAVMNFENNTTGATGELGFENGGMPAVYVMDNLIDSDRFNVMERMQLKAIVDEQSLNNTGLIEPSTFNQIGGLKGVEYLVLGNVVGLAVKEKEIAYGNETGNAFQNTQYTVTANIYARFVEVKTGRVVLTGNGEGASTSTHTEFDIERIKSLLNKDESYDSTGQQVKFGAVRVSQTQVHNALFKAAEDVVFGKYGFIKKLDRRAKRRK